MISEFPLFLFTTLAGASAGACAVRTAFPLTKDRKRPWLFTLVCIVLLGFGLLGVLFHLARPTMFLNALVNPGAGIAQEAYCSILFGLLLLVDIICDLKRKGGSPRALQVACGIVGLVLTFIMGMSYVGNFGVPAWTTWLTVAQFVVGDLALGAALYLAFEKGALSNMPFRITFTVVAAVFAVVLIFEGMHFNSLGIDSILFWVSEAFVLAAIICAAIAQRKDAPVTLYVVVLACALIGVCISRWGFYLACII